MNDFSSATIRFQIELNGSEESNSLIGGRCISCHTYTISSPLGEEGEDSMLNICQLVWECWGEEGAETTQYGMMLFDLDQWYKDQMPATYQLESNAFMSVLRPAAVGEGCGPALDARLVVTSVAPYSHATRLEEHFYPNSLQYNCICLNTSEAAILGTVGVQRQIINSIDEAGPTVLLSPGRLYHACVTAGLTPLYVPYSHGYGRNVTQEEQRRFLLSVALEARLTRFLKRCAHDWATGTHTGLGCTLSFLVEWCWKRALELKENAKELVAPLFTSTILPDRNIMRCLEHCVQQLTQLTGLLDAILTKCCNLVVPDALSEMEEKYKGIGIVSLYFQVVQWFLRVGLLPERHDGYEALPYPAHQLYNIYKKRRLKLHRLQENAPQEAEAGHRSCALLYIDQLIENEFGGQARLKLHRLQENAPQEAEAGHRSCALLYIDQLIENEFGGHRTHEMWMKGGSECEGVYPPPSLYSLLRLYLLPDVAEEHKHSLVLYLLLDYCTVYDEIRYEAVIRRLMQFPTMFGLSNTAIKATQAFWHLDHRDFDFALDQLQCLTGNTLSDWQHRVVLSSLLAQKKTQAALQYLHVRKPAPIQSPIRKDGISKVNDHDKLDDWQSCCNLYLARGLVFEAIDVIRMCVRNAATSEEKVRVLNFFYKGCRNTGQLSKVLQVTLLPGEEEVFIKYLKDCNDTQTSDILIMYYLQQARYVCHSVLFFHMLLRHRRSLSISVNSSLSDDPNASIESIADIPITLINPRYSNKGRQKSQSPKQDKCMEVDDFVCELRPMNETPRGRRSREISGQSTPLIHRSRSVTPERLDSPVLKTLQTNRSTRSRSRTPEMSPGSLEPIPEQPRQERDSDPHPAKTTLSIPRRLRSRSRTPELLESRVMESPKLTAITESPAKSYESPAPSPTRRTSRSRSHTPELNKRSVVEAPKLEPITETSGKSPYNDSPTSSPTRRALRSRSRTPEVEKLPEQTVDSPRSLRSRSRTPDVEKLPEQPILSSPRNLRSRSKTPEKLLSPKKDIASKGRKPLSRLVLEANAFAKTKQMGESSDVQTKESTTEQSESIIECTPLKASNTKSLIDVTFSPIVNKSILQSSTESFSLTEKVIQINESSSSTDLKPLPAFTTLHEVYFEKSVLQTDESSIIQSSLQEDSQKSTEASVPDVEMNALPQFTPINESDFNKSVLKSGDSSVAGNENKPTDVPKAIAFTTFNEAEFDNSVLKSHLSSVEISHESNANEEGKSYRDLSSLMTSDSDIEMVDDQKWKYKIDNENKDSVIQKEKEKIVEIEREINEIEEDIAEGDNSSDEENAEDSSGEDNVEHEDSSDEEIIEGENKEESSESEEADDEVSVSDSSDEVICLDDDSDSNPSDVNQQADKQTSEEIPQTNQTETQTEKIDVVENKTNTDVVSVETEKAIDEPKIEVCEEKPQEIHTETIIEVKIDQDIEMKDPENVQEQSIDVLNQANISLLTDDNSDVNLTYSDDSNHKEIVPAQPIVEVEVMVEKIAPTETEKNEIVTSNIQDMDVVDFCQPIATEPALIEEVITQESNEETEIKAESAAIKEPKDIFAENTLENTPAILETESVHKDTVENMEVITTPENITENVKTDITEMLKQNDDEIKKTKAPATRKRTQSTSSNKSNQDIEQEIPENITLEATTPSKRVSKSPMPKSRVMPKRRSSKDIADDIDESVTDETLTPRRRSTRSRSKNLDDNSSVASESSVKSSSSKIEEPTDKKPVARKGRKSILNTKTELSVIPEVEDNSQKIEESNQDILSEILTTERLTRNQKAMLESKLRPSTPRSRRASAASKSEASIDEDNTPDIHTIDRVQLLDKETFDGRADDEEFPRASPTLSDTVKPRPRTARSASETETQAKAKKITRRTSVDVTLDASPVRGRRASFNRACEALHTPKGRRPSVDTKKEARFGKTTLDKRRRWLEGLRSAINRLLGNGDITRSCYNSWFG
ncbi:Protein ELYS [Papilio machaon]|uniref:Protein ELYS n=1 Tax=Papilio machaon TaxID=76193 RepID=A0A194R528_PAPMA|nr:Protein ELYS [Papilio machaon]